MKKLNILVLAFLAIISCKDDDNTVIDTSPKVGSVTMDFSNKIGTDAIVLNTGTYTNQSNEEYTIAELKYIVSNIVLVKANGEEFTYPVADSYFVVNEEVAESKKITLNDIDAAGYTKIKIGFGVDQCFGVGLLDISFLNLKVPILRKEVKPLITYCISVVMEQH